eukprot:9255544-Pyramimonas_sp.AAC.2
MHMPGGGQEGVRRVSGGGQEGVYLIRMRIAQHVQSKTDVWICESSELPVPCLVHQVMTGLAV